MDFFYGLRSLKHHASYNIGKRSILKGGIPQCDLNPKDTSYFHQLRDTEQQRLRDDTDGLKALADAQRAHAERLALWGRYHALNDSYKAHQLGTKLDRKISQAKHAGTIAEKKRTHKELLAATREANDRMKWQTVDTQATASQQAAQGEQSQQQWGQV